MHASLGARLQRRFVVVVNLELELLGQDYMITKPAFIYSYLLFNNQTQQLLQG